MVQRQFLYFRKHPSFDNNQHWKSRDKGSFISSYANVHLEQMPQAFKDVSPFVIGVVIAHVKSNFLLQDRLFGNDTEGRTKHFQSACLSRLFIGCGDHSA
jgi:hypothetical protein